MPSRATVSASRAQLPASIIGLATLIAILPACVGIATLHRPETIGAGQWQVGVESSLQGAVGAAGSTVYPTFDGSFRYGLRDNLEVGSRIGASGLGGFAKVLVVESNDHQRALALLPQLSGSYLTLGGKRTSFVSLDVPALFGMRLNDHWQAILAPRLVQTLAMAHRKRGMVANLVVSGGSTVGTVWQATKSVAVMPELGLLIPFAGQDSAPDAGGGNITVAGVDVLCQFSIGLLVTP